MFISESVLVNVEMSLVLQLILSVSAESGDESWTESGDKTDS